MRAIEFIDENFADGKHPGRKGLAKRSGVNTKASVSSLRKTAKHSTGEKARMAHWLANMKAGRAKHEDIETDEGWKDVAAAGAMAGAMMFGHGDAAAKTVPPQPVVAKQVQSVTGSPLEAVLKKTAIKSGIKGTELAALLSQCAHETMNFQHMKEIGGKLDFKKYDPRFAPKKAKALGNVKAGDGALYKGRGYIQLTGRENYRKAGEALGLPLEQHPEMVEKPEIAAKVAVWYWQHRVQPKVGNFDDVASVTKPINPGLKGLEQRKDSFKDFKVAMR